MAVVIKDLLPKPVQVSVGSGTIEVSGLCMDDIVELIETHRENLAQFFTKDNVDASGMILSAPQMVAEIIAMGADARGQEVDILKLPAASQIEALLAIWNLTVPDLKKLKESLLGVVAALSKVNEDVEKDPQIALKLPSESTSQS